MCIRLFCPHFVASAQSYLLSLDASPRPCDSFCTYNFSVSHGRCGFRMLPTNLNALMLQHTSIAFVGHKLSVKWQLRQISVCAVLHILLVPVGGLDEHPLAAKSMQGRGMWRLARKTLRARHAWRNQADHDAFHERAFRNQGPSPTPACRVHVMLRNREAIVRALACVDCVVRIGGSHVGASELVRTLRGRFHRPKGPAE